MADDISAGFVKHLLGMLDETWHGAHGDGWSYYGDQDAGLEQSLQGLSAAQAGLVHGATSIAQQVKHTAFSARVFAGWIRAEHPDADWGASFRLDSLDETGWEALKDELWVALAELRDAVEAHVTDSQDATGSAIGAVGHVVYHLGAIRSKLTLLKAAG